MTIQSIKSKHTVQGYDEAVSMLEAIQLFLWNDDCEAYGNIEEALDGIHKHLNSETGSDPYYDQHRLTGKQLGVK